MRIFRGTLFGSDVYGMAERVGFAPLLVIENKELKGFLVPHDPLKVLKSQGRRTYCARGAVYVTYMA
jgi:hypothetical protein